jgi:zinc-ribbon domain
MFCPKCAAQNVDQASFCRVCGANISLVPQALSGQLPAAADNSGGARRAAKRRDREPGLEGAIPTFFTGLAFLVVSVVLAFSEMGYGWWFWMLIPAFSCLGSGIAQYFKYREARNRIAQQFAIQSSLGAPPAAASLPTRNTGALLPPPASVTEGTTRHLGTEAPTRHLDS